MVLTKKKELTYDFLMTRLSEFDVYKFVLPDLEAISRPVLNRHRGEKDASLLVYLGKDNHLHHVDMGDDSYTGRCIDLVCQFYGINYDQALHMVARNFGLLEGNSDVYQQMTSKYVQPVLDQRRHCQIHVKAKKWEDKELEYWTQYGITLEELKKEQIYSVKEWSINRKRQVIHPQEFCFCYVFKEGYKIYYPHRPKSNPEKPLEGKWYSNIPTSLVENTECLNGSPVVVLTKSRKDRIVISKMVHEVINCQNESVAFITPELIERLKNKTVYLAFDSDEAGKRSSKRITMEMNLGWKHLNVPDFLLQEQVKDFSDWSKARGGDVTEIQQFLISKGVI